MGGLKLFPLENSRITFVIQLLDNKSHHICHLKMNTISERYYTLKSSGIAKRIDDATSLLKEHHLHHKGLTQSLNKLREILLVDLPALEKSLQRTRKLSWFLNFLLILIAI